MPNYRVLAHPRVLAYLKDIKNENEKNRLKEAMTSLEDYPFSLRNMDVEKMKGRKRTFRIRVGDHRVLFSVDKKERVIYVTGINRRENVYNGVD